MQVFTEEGGRRLPCVGQRAKSELWYLSVAALRRLYREYGGTADTSVMTKGAVVRALLELPGELTLVNDEGYEPGEEVSRG